LEDAGNHRQARGEQADPKTLDMIQTSSAHIGRESLSQVAVEGVEFSPGPLSVDPENPQKHAHVGYVEKDPTLSVSIFLALLLKKLVSLITVALQGFLFYRQDLKEAENHWQAQCEQ
jgi:hypothetical protein